MPGGTALSSAPQMWRSLVHLHKMAEVQPRIMRDLAKEKVKFSRAIEDFTWYAGEGLAFGAKLPQLFERLWGQFETPVEQGRWDLARAAGLDIPAQQDVIPLTEMVRDILVEISEFASRFFPELVDALDLRSPVPNQVADSQPVRAEATKTAADLRADAIILEGTENGMVKLGALKRAMNEILADGGTLPFPEVVEEDAAISEGLRAILKLRQEGNQDLQEAANLRQAAERLLRHSGEDQDLQRAAESRQAVIQGLQHAEKLQQAGEAALKEVAELKAALVEGLGTQKATRLWERAVKEAADQ